MKKKTTINGQINTNLNEKLTIVKKKGRKRTKTKKIIFPTNEKKE